MLRQRNRHRIGQRHRFDTAIPAYLAVGRMNAAYRKSLQHTITELRFLHYASEPAAPGPVFPVPFAEAGRTEARSAATSGFRAGAGKFASCIAPVGHSGTHLRHRRHLLKSIYARLFTSVMASNGQALTHFPHPMQATEQFRRATPPLSLFMQATYTRRSRGPFLRSSKSIFGHFFTHAPQAVHFSWSTTGNPVAGSMCNASKLQTATQSPLPRQPNEHPVSPA